MAHELAAMVIAEGPTQSVIGKICFQSSQRSRRRCDGKNGLRRPHLLRLPLAEQTTVVIDELSAIELELHPLCHILSAGVDRPCWTSIIEDFEGNYPKLSVDALVRRSIVVPVLEQGIGYA